MAAGDSPLAPGLSSLALGCSLQSLLLSLPPPCICQALPGLFPLCCEAAAFLLAALHRWLLRSFPCCKWGILGRGLAGTWAGMFLSAQLGAEVELPALWEQQVLCVCRGTLMLLPEVGTGHGLRGAAGGACLSWCPGRVMQPS